MLGCMRFHRMRNFTLFLAMLLCATVSATGQDLTVGVSLQTPTASGSPRAAAGFAPKAWQLTVGYQYNRIDIRGAFKPFDTNGLSASVTRYFGSLPGIEAEVGSGFGTAASGVSAKSVFVGAGPHLAYRRHSRFEPWVHGLVGAEHFNFGGVPFPGKTTSAAWTAGGGMDYRFDSGFALRLQADYLGSHFGGAYQRNLQVAGAIVWNF
jgi:opacity protein-like surface antigen